MYNPLNFIVNLNTGQLIELIIGGTTSLIFNVRNNDLNKTLYNMSFNLELGDGIELVDSSVQYTNVNGNIYSFTNLKDLAPNEINYFITVTIKLKDKISSGDTIPFGSLIKCRFMATADTMPRGNYDSENEIIESKLSFSIKASRYTIYKINPSKLLLGNIYSSKIIIKTAETSEIYFEKIYDVLGNGVNYLNNLSITGYSSYELNNFQVISPSELNNSFKLLWNNVLIPANTTVIIQYDVKINEKYYINGYIEGQYIENGTSITNQLNWRVDEIDLSYDYSFVSYEVILELILSKYVVDIREGINYKVNFYVNAYHDLFNLSGYLITSDGQILSNISTPMYTEKNVSSGGVTQVTWNVGNISSGTTTTINMDGNIGTLYLKDEADILAGDVFHVSTICNSISSATNKIITYTDSDNFKINVPSVSKNITGYFYRDNTPKNFNVLAPGDYISYKAIYNINNLSAPTSQVKLFDFYPYMTRNILDINYQYSSQQYPGSGVVPINPYGILWFINEIGENKSFEIDYKTQIDYENSSTKFPYNLFKLQVVNSDGISYSSRSQVGFSLGKPNLVLNKNVDGNNPNDIKIGEIYSFSIVLKNSNINNDVTDAFDVNFTESISNYATLNSLTVIAKVNETIIPTILENSGISIHITKLAPNDVFTLNYSVTINEMLGPNKELNFISSTTAPYTQAYDENNTNFQYNTGALTENLILKSKPIVTSLNSDASTKLIGESVYYTLNITIPKGEKLQSLYAVILIPSTQLYSGEAWLNNSSVTTKVENGRIIFNTINDIDTTSDEMVYNYKIKCLVDDSDVLFQNTAYNIETYYASINYMDMFSNNSNLGVSNTLTINHPYLHLNIESSNVMNGFKQYYIVGSNNIVYTKITALNLGNTLAKNIQATVNMPNYLNFISVETASNGVNSSYNSDTKRLTVTINNIDFNNNKYLIIKSNISSGEQVGNKLIITGYVNQYFNIISTKYIYSSDIIYNNELYLNSVISFLPLTFYKLSGSDAAINLSPPGKPTQIEYILINTGQGIDSYKLEMTPMMYEYKVYIGSTFIQTVNPNSKVVITSQFLNNIATGDSKYITFKYTIPMETQEPYYATMLVTATSLNDSHATKTIPTTFQDP